MLRKSRLIKSLSILTFLLLGLANKAAGVALLRVTAPPLASQNASLEFAAIFTPPEPVGAAIIYKWNIEDTQLPLLGLANDRITPGFDQLLSYPVAGFSFPVFRPLNFDEEQGRYILPAISPESGQMHFVQFAPSGISNRYMSLGGTDIELVDNDNLKTFRAADGTKFIFVRYPDGEFRCATIKSAAGVTLNLLYAANGLTLHGVVDSLGRSLTFNHGKDGIDSITQSWMANSEGLNRTWPVGNQLENSRDGVTKYAHSVADTLKRLPPNAVIHEYTSEMAASDKILAQIFGGPQSVAGANGFEPSGLGAQYPLYRGDIIGDDGRLRTGHLSHAMHLYGSPDGTGDSPLYVPPGFTSHSSEPSPTDAAVLFYYPRLGSLTDITLAVFHVANFQITYEGNRVRIGNIGGPGGSSAHYKHSHIDFYRGNTSLPPAAARPALRIDPATVFRSR